MSFYRRSSYKKEDLLLSGNAGIFGAGNAKLPAPNMLMMDRIVRINNDGGDHGLGEIIAELDILGKNIGSDLKDGKMTLPLIYAQGSVSGSDRAMIRDVVMNKQNERLIEVRELVKSSGGLEYSLEVARKQVLLAQEALSLLPNNVYTNDLIDLAEFSVDRVL